MSFDWMRRGLLALVPGLVLALAGCGSSSIESQFIPARIFAFGDSFTDVGNRGTRYTVNDGSVNVWAISVAAQYQLAMTPSVSGGNDYAYGNSRIVTKPDAAGDATTPTLKDQIDTFLGSKTVTQQDMILIGAGTADLIAEIMKYRNGAQTSDQMIANIKAAAAAEAAQAKRFVAAGATHVVVVPPYDLGKAPWATAISNPDLLHAASSAFADELLVDLVDQGANMLYVDTQLLFNLIVGNPGTYALSDIGSPVCTSNDPGPGIGIGNGQINSALCTPATIVAGANYSTFLWADLVYPTAIGAQRFGEYVYSRTTNRW